MPALPPAPSSLRFRVDPADVPAEKAARRLHLSLGQFEILLPELLGRGFPAADPTTGMYDLEAIDRWRAERHRRPPPLTAEAAPLQPVAPDQRVDRVERFCAAKERETSRRRRHRAPS